MAPPLEGGGVFISNRRKKDEQSPQVARQGSHDDAE